MKTWPEAEQKTIIAGWQHDAHGWWWQNADDRLPSAQREIMVLVTETGHEVLAW